jgi:alanyl-tRNA synthetase
VVVALSEDARARGLSANELVKVAAGVLGGSGGGKDDIAQGGGADASAIGEALVQVERAVAARVGV